MRKLAILPVVALLVAACSESPTDPTADFGVRFSSEEGNAIHELTTPSDVVAEKQSETSIRVTWSPAYAALVSECDTFADDNQLNSATTCKGVHFEIYRNGAWVADVEGNEFIDTELEPGSHYYEIKSKGLEQTPREASFTYHSLTSDPSNTIVLGLQCGVPTVTAALTGGNATYTKDNSTVNVTFSGTTTNFAGCAGAAAEFRIVAKNTNNGNVVAEHSTDWASLMDAFSGADYSKIVTLTRNNKNIVFEFQVRVMHDAEPTWVIPVDGPPTVTII